MRDSLFHFLYVKVKKNVCVFKKPSLKYISNVCNRYPLHLLNADKIFWPVSIKIFSSLEKIIMAKLKFDFQKFITVNFSIITLSYIWIHINKLLTCMFKQISYLFIVPFLRFVENTFTCTRETDRHRRRKRQRQRERNDEDILFCLSIIYSRYLYISHTTV